MLDFHNLLALRLVSFLLVFQRFLRLPLPFCLPLHIPSQFFDSLALLVDQSVLVADLFAHSVDLILLFGDLRSELRGYLGEFDLLLG